MSNRTVVPQGKIFPSLLRVAKKKGERFDDYFKSVSPWEIKPELWGIFHKAESRIKLTSLKKSRGKLSKFRQGCPE